MNEGNSFNGLFGKSGGVTWNNMVPRRTSCRWLLANPKFDLLELAQQ